MKSPRARARPRRGRRANDKKRWRVGAILLPYESAADPCVDVTDVAFYQIDGAVPVPQLDRAGTELPLDALTPEQQRNYDALTVELNTLLGSAPDCPGDGNIDSVVDQQDLSDWQRYSTAYGLSSVHDLNLDGLTDAADESIIQANLGLECQSQ